MKEEQKNGIGKRQCSSDGDLRSQFVVLKEVPNTADILNRGKVRSKNRFTRDWLPSGNNPPLSPIVVPIGERQEPRMTMIRKGRLLEKGKVRRCV